MKLNHILLIVITLFAVVLAGCVNPAPKTDATVTPTPAPTTGYVAPTPTPNQPLTYGGGGNLPIPISHGYIGSNAVDDTNLYPNAIQFNVTKNTTGTTISGTGLARIDVNGTLNVSRQSMVMTTVSLNAITTAASTAYMQVQVSGCPNCVGIATSPTIVTLAANYTLHSLSYTFYNTSIQGGSYQVSLWAGLHNTGGTVVLSNISMVTEALPT